MSDRSTRVLLLCIAVALWALVFKGDGLASIPTVNAQPKRVVEYDILIAPGAQTTALVSDLDQRAKDGWRAVGYATVVTTGGGAQVTVLLERER